jgi:Glu-tRNA(Gln) amidotransferase subunit E-like FAD-binding protein
MEIEIKSGLEIHQQLNTSKLFCRCPSVLRTEAPKYTIERKLHAVAGEEGKVDKAAEFEAAKGKTFIYEVYDTNCLVELDECPPEEINTEALKIALQISLLLNAKILPYSQIMRKTVLDGSNTSGFQRTVLIARDGWLETEQGKIGIDSIALEEDAARIIKKENNKSIYRLDRLGIPLIEIATKPEIKSAEQAKEVALKIGEILRACNVKRGIGTIRQDVNLSIKIKEKNKFFQGKRIEIKGVQEPRLIEKTILTETERQKPLVLEGKSQGEVRNANPDGTTTFLRPMPGADRMYPETDLPLLKLSRSLIDEVKKTLPKLKSEIAGELKEKGLNQEMMNLLLKENKLEEFHELLKIYNNPNLIVKAITLWPKELASKEHKTQEKINESLDIEKIIDIFKLLRDKKINEDKIKQLLEVIIRGKTIEEATIEQLSDKGELEEEIIRLVKEKPGLNINAYMGLMMGKFKGKFSGKEIMEILKNYVK